MMSTEISGISVTLELGPEANLNCSGPYKGQQVKNPKIIFFRFEILNLHNPQNLNKNLSMQEIVHTSSVRTKPVPLCPHSFICLSSADAS